MTEHRKKLKYVTAIRNPRLSTKAATIYASAMLPQRKDSNQQLYLYAMVVGLVVEDRDDQTLRTPKVLYTFPHQVTLSQRVNES